MSEGEDRVRVAVTTYFPMFIAVLSLVTSIYNGYLNNKFVDLVQNNVARVEYLRTCKEIIDAYFQVKFRVGLFVLIALLWFYLLSLGIMAGAVINSLRFELHETGELPYGNGSGPPANPCAGLSAGCGCVRGIEQ